MAETIKNFYNDTILASESADVISNDANTKALVKTISVCNISQVSSAFSIRLNNQMIYQEVPIESKETVKLENENLVVDEGVVLAIDNNSSIYPLLKQGAFGTSPNQIFQKKVSTGERLFFYKIDGTTSPIYYRVYDKYGNFLVNGEFSLGDGSDVEFCVEEREDRVVVAGPNGAASTYSLTIDKNNWQSQGSSQAKFERVYERNLVSSNDKTRSFLIGVEQSSKNLIGSVQISGNHSEMLLLPDGSSYDFSQTYVASLSNGNIVVAFQDQSGPNYHCYFIQYDSNLSQVGNTTQWYTAAGTTSLILYAIEGLSNGKFAVLYADNANASYPKLAIFNNDLTSAIAPITLRTASTMSFTNNRCNKALQVDAANHLYIFYYDTDPIYDGNYPYKVDIYNSNGQSITRGKTIDNLTSQMSNEVFDLDPETRNITVAYRDNDKLAFSEFIPESPINATVSGVEVTQS